MLAFPLMAKNSRLQLHYTGYLTCLGHANVSVTHQYCVHVHINWQCYLKPSAKSLIHVKRYHRVGLVDLRPYIVLPGVLLNTTKLHMMFPLATTS